MANFRAGATLPLTKMEKNLERKSSQKDANLTKRDLEDRFNKYDWLGRRTNYKMRGMLDYVVLR